MALRICITLKFQPKRMAILICDFRGFVEPEMIKMRPVVVLRAHKRNGKLVTIVPLSTTRPTHLEDFHVELPFCPLPGVLSSTRVWAKCDMIYTVSIDRLAKYRFQSESFSLSVGGQEFSAIERGVLSGLGLANQLKQLP